MIWRIFIFLKKISIIFLASMYYSVELTYGLKKKMSLENLFVYLFVYFVCLIFKNKRPNLVLNRYIIWSSVNFIIKMTSSNQTFKFITGPGNNSSLVKKIVKKRGVWDEVSVQSLIFFYFFFTIKHFYMIFLLFRLMMIIGILFWCATSFGSPQIYL